jgi:hypothetical protein
MTPSSKKPAAEGQPERRRQPELREVIQELLDHIRDLAGRARSLSEMELEYSQQRLEWLSDEVWRTLLEKEGIEPKD